MKLLKLEVEGYRSLKNVSWEPGDLNVVIGPNAGGKSNLLKLLDLLAQAARGELGQLVLHEGGMEPMVWDGQAKRIRVSVNTTPLPPYTDAEKHSVTYELVMERLGGTSAYRIGHEVLGNFNVKEGEAPYILLKRDPQQATVFSVERQGFEAPPKSVPQDETLLSLSAGPFTANQYVADFKHKVAGWSIHQEFDTGQSAAIRRAQVTRADAQVEADGQNLIAVLHTLYTGNPDFEEEIDNAMFAAFGDDFVKLTFPPAADQRIQLRIRWKSLTQARSSADLSDGTLRFLFLLAVLANPSPPPLIAIDEPETGLHPRMLRIVAEYAREAARRSQVILTTHSAEMLDAFGHEPPTTTIVEREEGQTILRTVAADELAYWLNQYTLGELYRHKDLEAMK